MLCVLRLEYTFYANFLHNMETKLSRKEKEKYVLKLIPASPSQTRAVCGYSMHLHSTYARRVSIVLSVS